MSESESALKYLLERALAEPTGRRFRDRLPGWLDSFARTLGLPGLPIPLRPGDWLAVVEQGALHVVLGQEPADEPEWARQFRACGAGKPRSLLAGSGTTSRATRAPGAFPVFRRNLFEQVRREHERAVTLFEL